jgi:hypothetical protein
VKKHGARLPQSGLKPDPLLGAAFRPTLLEEIEGTFSGKGGKMTRRVHVESLIRNEERTDHSDWSHRNNDGPRTRVVKHNA